MEGVLFDPESLAVFREQIEYDYYKALKTFSAKHDLPLEVPSKGDLERILADAGFDLQNTSVEYLLEFVSLENDLGGDVQSLRKLSATRNALNGISHKKNTCFPQVLVQGTRTSRILLKSPTIQNVAKKYRSVIIPNTDMKLSYIDYDQFEVGIMGALSDDPVLLELYAQDDIYLAIAERLFGAHGSRKHAKKLFLSYAYGMRKNNLVDAAVSLGSTRVKAREAFNQFAVFENWKKGIQRELKTHRKVGTSLGNFFHLRHKYHPTAKEVRSAISQKVQGTGALIFKLALLEISPLHDFRVVLPMHDAVLVEHSLDSDPEVVATAFANAMTNFFANKIVGKASISDFFAD